MRANIVILGGGQVGRAVALDLAVEHRVKLVDRDSRALSFPGSAEIETETIDVTRTEHLASTVKGADLVISAVPGEIGFATLETVIRTGADVVDIAFSPEDPFALNDLAQEHEVTAVVDAGVAPGLSHLIAGYHQARGSINSFCCYVGGLPRVRTWPFEYKAPFSPRDVIEEYLRPARFKRAGEIVTSPALSDPELVEFDGIGTLEAFNTDGLRTLLQTSIIPDMTEKTCRYPGHRQLILALKQAGFFSESALTLSGRPIRPIDFTAEILRKAWSLDPEEPEFTVMRLILVGDEELRYDLYDSRDERSGLSSMARTTGFTCTAVARRLLAGEIKLKGICAPERLGEDETCFNNIISDLEQRGVRLTVAKGVR